MAKAIYKACKRTIENKKGTEGFKDDMVKKLDLYMAADKISAEEYEELTALMEDEDEKNL